MVTPMLRPDLFGALGTHAGDALFELCYWRDVPEVVRALRDHYDGSYAAVLRGPARPPAAEPQGGRDAVQHVGDGRRVLRRR